VISEDGSLCLSVDDFIAWDKGLRAGAVEGERG
jgi:hypothetical protein